ncbi:non-structural maintenance of chromosomes element 3 homolog isoform X1 [Mytilus galloprovincialis]|uniref:non-structural maintenance of chromosomes element 3 homolog isoform X1 n=1 Tax=Mytilus galloprovincialis TaxID=29158 RepID=UPI003F7CB12B
MGDLHDFCDCKPIVCYVLHVDDEMPSGSQMSASQSMTQSMTQAEKAAQNMDPAEQEKRLNDLVQYLLIMDQKKIPIKKIDINKQVLKEFSKTFPYMIKKAGEKLLKVFGIELIQLEDKLKGTYMLVNRIDTDVDELEEAGHGHILTPMKWPEEDNSKTGLLLVVLSLVFMNGEVMQDTHLWHTLRKLGIDQDMPHEVFGDTKKLLTQEFVRQGYIEYIRQPNTDPAVYDFRWGQRARHEISKRTCLNFVCQLYDDRDPEQWTSQYAAVLEDEGVQNGVQT